MLPFFRTKYCLAFFNVTTTQRLYVPLKIET